MLKKSPTSFRVPATQSTFFERDESGRFKLDDKGLPYQSTNEVFIKEVELSTRDTAFFVIDPWNDAPSDFLNKYYGKITENYILPLIKKANEAGFPVYVFTNDCDAIKPIPYSCEIPKQFHLMKKQYSKMEIISWQEIDLPVFIKSLRDKGVSNLIYTGFASNLCIMIRPTGMVHMVQEGFTPYIIPEASAAVEKEGSWQSQDIHKATLTTISQWAGKLIYYADIDKQIQLSKNTHHDA